LGPFASGWPGSGQLKLEAHTSCRDGRCVTGWTGVAIAGQKDAGQSYARDKYVLAPCVRVETLDSVVIVPELDGIRKLKTESGCKPLLEGNAEDGKLAKPSQHRQADVALKISPVARIGVQAAKDPSEKREVKTRSRRRVGGALFFTAITADECSR
jgi:hypothetical protein